MRTLFLFLFLLVNSVLLFSQSPLSDSEKKFKEVYDNIHFLTSENPEKAIQMADSLYLASTSNSHKSKSLFLKGKAYAVKAEANTALEIYKEAEQIAAKTDDYYWQSTLSIATANIFLMGGLSEEAEKYIGKALVASEKITDKKDAIIVESAIYKLQGLKLYFQPEPDLKGSLAYFHKIDKLLEQYTKENYPKRYFHHVENDFYIGELYFELENNDSAYFYYKRARDYYEKPGQQDARYESLILLGIEKTKPKKSESDSLSQIAQNALSLAEKINSDYLKAEAYGALLETNPDTATAKEYIKKSYEANKKDFQTRADISSQYLQRINKEKEKLSVFLKVLTGVGVLLLAGIIYVIVRYRQNNKRNLEKYRKLMHQLEENNELPVQKNTLKNSDYSPENEEKKDILPEKTEEELLRRLEKFEKGNKFNDKNISLPLLASMLNSNTRYVSYLINKHRDQNFNDYIQHLRITYIINKMKDDPKYLDYKISFLAEECGFSSHSKFSKAFDKIVGMNPSAFMRLRGREEKGLINY